MVFSSEAGSTLQGTTEFNITKGDTVTFPVVVVTDTTKEFDKWINEATGEEVTSTTQFNSDCTIKAVLKQKPYSPSSYFIMDNSTGTITSLSDDYNNLPSAPNEIIIPRSIGGSTVKGLANNLFLGRDTLTTVVLPDTINTIGSYTFKNCSNLVNVNIPSDVTTIGYSTFENCNKLKSVNIPNVTRVGNLAFKNCTDLNSIGTDIRLNSMYIGEEAFSGCSSLDVVIDCQNATQIVDTNSLAGVKSISIIGNTYNNLPEICSEAWGLQAAVTTGATIHFNDTSDQLNMYRGDASISRPYGKHDLLMFVGFDGNVLEPVSNEAWEEELPGNFGFTEKQKHYYTSMKSDGSYKVILGDYNHRNYFDMKGLLDEVPHVVLTWVRSSDNKKDYWNKRMIRGVTYDLQGYSYIGDAKINEYRTSFPKLSLDMPINYMDKAFAYNTNVTGEITIPKSVTDLSDIFTGTVKPITMKYSKDCQAAVDFVAPSNVTKVQID